MSRSDRWRLLAIGGTALLMMAPERLHACPVCFGASDSLMAQGMNMGVFVLLGVTVTVLGSFAAFFLYLMRRAKLASSLEASVITAEVAEPGEKDFSLRAPRAPRLRNGSLEEPV